MANISPVDVVKTARYRVVKWENVTENDTCLPLKTEGFSDKTIQVSGTYGGETIAIEGSNDGVSYVTLTDNFGANLSFSSANGISLISESPLYIQPDVAGDGTSTDLDITLLCNSSGR